MNAKHAIGMALVAMLVLVVVPAATAEDCYYNDTGPGVARVSNTTCFHDDGRITGGGATWVAGHESPYVYSL